MLKAKKIVIAGAGGLLGSSLVGAVLDAGADVIAVDRDLSSMKQRLIKTGVQMPQERVSLVELDLTHESEVKGFFDALGGVSGAVNCAYPRSASYGRRFFDVSFDSFNENVSLHLGSAFLFSQQCAAYFERHKSPFSLVNIASIYGVIAPKFGIYEGTKMTVPVEYAAIKAAIVHLTRYVAAFVKDSRFQVNTVSPGGILDNQPDVFLGAYGQQAHGKGMLDVKDVVGTIVYLLSDSAKYVTGQNIIVDDGFTL